MLIAMPNFVAASLAQKRVDLDVAHATTNPCPIAISKVSLPERRNVPASFVVLPQTVISRHGATGLDREWQ